MDQFHLDGTEIDHLEHTGCVEVQGLFVGCAEPHFSNSIIIDIMSVSILLSLEYHF